MSVRRRELEDALIYKRRISAGTYQRQSDKLCEEMTLAKLEQHESTVDELDVEGALAFAERLLTNPAHILEGA